MGAGRWSYGGVGLCLLVVLQQTAFAGVAQTNLSALSDTELVTTIASESFTTNADLVVKAAVTGTAAIPANELTAGESCKLSGHVDECCNCTYQDVDRLNTALHPLLTQLVRTAFFRYFKVNIYCDCPLWPDDSMCVMRACSVCECEQSEVPQPWRQQEEEGWCNSNQCAAELDSKVDSTVDPDTALRLVSLKGWRGFNNPWMAESEGPDDYLYVNLLINPERYTGYAGEHAHRIWNSIYSQSCFQRASPPASSSSSSPATLLASVAASDPAMCPEKRVFYRLISGMHASISAHISANYLLDEERGLWGHNLTDFRARLGTPEVRDRVENLYFAYLFVLRAVIKAAPLLARYDFETGLADEDRLTADLMKQLLGSPELRTSCPMPFDEGRLWKGGDGLALREELRSAFVNITRIMDCVGCEKCKLWGKLQTLGVATALKVLFSSSDCAGLLPTSPSMSTLVLERNEIIALVNLLERFSASIQYYKELSAELQVQDGAEQAPLPVAVGDPVS